MVRRTKSRKSKKAIAKRRQAIFRTVLILAVILAIAILIWFIRKPKQPDDPSILPTEKGIVTLYFQDKSQMFIVPVQREVKLGSMENILLRTLKELLRGPWEDTVNLRGSLPDGCNVLSVNLHGVTATVNFNNLTLDLLDEQTESVFVDSVVHSLCAFDEIQRVDFLFEGKRIPHLPYGSIDFSGPHVPGELNRSFAPEPEGDSVKITLYFLDKSSMYLVPITEYIENPGAQNRVIMVALKRLLNGPESADAGYLSPLFKPGVNIREQEGVVLSGGRLTLALTAQDPADMLIANEIKAFLGLRLTLDDLLDFENFTVLVNDIPVEELLGFTFKLDDLYANTRLNKLTGQVGQAPEESDGDVIADE